MPNEKAKTEFETAVVYHQNGQTDRHVFSAIKPSTAKSSPKSDKPIIIQTKKKGK